MPEKGFIDDLTGLYNRRYLQRRITNEIERCKRYELPLSVSLLDLDDFKQINDLEGHIAGDKILVNFSDFLKKSVRGADIVVRYGGDEFVIIFPNTRIQQAKAVMERLLEDLGEEQFNGHKMSASVGIAAFPEDGKDWERLFQKSDVRMYHAKRTNKGSICSEEAETKELSIPTDSLIGRNVEIQEISDFLEDESGKLLVVTGEAGAGKTRLVKEAVDGNRENFLLVGSSYPAMWGSPYYAVRAVLQNLLSEKQDMVSQIFVDHLNLPQKRALSSFLPSIYSSSSKLEPTGDKLMFFDTITKFLDYIADEISIILLFDDLHWASDSTIDLLHFMLKSRKNDYPLFGTYRTEEIEGSPFGDKLGLLARENLYREMNLKTLNRNSTDEMVSTIVSGTPSEPLNHFVYEQSGGNPFFIEEILKKLKDSGALLKRGDKCEYDESINFEMPETIEGTVNHKLTLLDEKQTEIINIVALLGKDFNFGILQKISGINEGELYDILDELKSFQLIQEKEEEEYSFKEEVFRSAIEGKILKGTKRKIHGKIADILKETHPESPHKYEQLAYHYHRAGDGENIVDPAEKAGDHAKSIYAHKESVRFYSWALEGKMSSDRRSKILEKIASEYAIKGEYEEAIDGYKEALENSQNQKFSAELYKKLGNTYEEIGNYERALKYLREARKNYSTWQEKYTCDPSIAWVYLRLGNDKSSLRSAKRATEKIDREKYPKEYSQALNTLASINHENGNYEKAIEYFKEAREIREDIGYLEGLGSIYNNMAGVYLDINDLEQAKSYFRKALELYRETGFKEGEITTTYNMGILELRKNRIDHAEEYLRDSLDMVEWVGGIASKARILGVLGLIHFFKGSLKEGQELLSQSLKTAKRTQSPDIAVIAYSRIAEFNCQFLKNIDRMKEYLEKAGEVIENSELKKHKTLSLYRYYRALARYYLETEQIDKGVDVIKEHLLPISEERSSNYMLYITYQIWAVFYAKKGWDKWGSRYLDRARKYAEEQQDEFNLADVFFHEGWYYKILEDYEKSKESYKKALDIYKDLQFDWYIKETKEKLEELDRLSSSKE